jgi:hypothetical protein
MKSNLSQRSIFLSAIAILSLYGMASEQLSAIDIGPMTWTPRADWINVKSCSAITGGPNAVGNGMADDTTALQDVLNYLEANRYGRIKTVYFPAGTYKISSTLTISQIDGIQMIGNGANTIISWAGASGGAMFWPNSTDNMRYTGFVWNGNNLAGCAYEHNSSQGGYETNIRHENESFKNFTVSGNYSYVGVDGNTINEVAPASAVISGFTDAQVSGETMFYNCAFSNCTNGIIDAYQTFQNYMWHMNGCEFENCGNGVNLCNGGCFIISNCHFHGSTGTDIVGGFSVRVRHCTSQGSNRFYLEGQDGSLSQDVFQDCWVDGWTGTANPAGPLILGTYGANSVFDCVFTNPPAGGTAPIEEIQNYAEILLSNNYAPNFAGGTGIIYYATPSIIDFVPPGIRFSTLTSASQTFLKTTWPADSKHILDVTKAPYNADPTFTSDCTSAFQSAINAAQTANNGSIVYVPNGLYKISSTLSVTGKNFSIQGDGERTQVCWYAPSNGTMMTIATPSKVNVQYIHFSCLSNLPGNPGYVSTAPTCDPTTITGIKETSTGTSSITYDDFYYDAYGLGNVGATGDNSNGPGLVLSNLPANSTVYIPHSYTTLTVQNCGAAQIYAKYLAIGEVNVSGTGAKTGFLGVLVAEGGQQSNVNAYTLQVNDNQDLAFGDYYSEQSRNDLELLRGAGTGTGRVTIQGFVSSAGVNGNPGGFNAPTTSININNYAGRLYYGPQSFGNNAGQSPVQITQRGTNPVDLLLPGDVYTDGAPTISLQSGASLAQTENTYLDSSNNLFYLPENPNPLTNTNLLSMSQSLDHLRQLEAVDMSVEFGLTTDAPPVAAYAMENSVLDLTGTYNGTNHGATFVDGASGSYAAQFNGTAGYIQIAKPVTTNFSISMWIQTKDTGASGQWYAGKGLVDGYTGASKADFGTALNAGKFSLGIGKPDTTLTSTVAVNDGNWHHVVATRSSSSGAMQVYVDGVLNNSVTGPTGSRSAGTNVRIGSIQTGLNGGFFKGSIDQIQIYNYVLSAADITYLYTRNQPQLPVSSGLVGHWRLDEATGTTSYDTSVSGINGTWQNSPTFSATYPQNIYGYMDLHFPDPGNLSFNGTNQYVNMGNPSVLPTGTGARTICGWAKANSTTGLGVIASFGAATTSEAMYIGMNGTSLVGGGFNNDLTASNIWDNNWHFIALTYDGTTANLYADGQLRASSAESWNLVHSACDIGAQVNGSNFWNGNIDDVRIYNRALTGTEIAHLAAGNP